MNIVFLLKSYSSLGGVEKVTKIITEKLKLDGFNIYILTFSEIEKSCLETVIPVDSFPNRNVYSSQNVRFLVDYIQLNNIDLIVFQGIYWDVVSFLFLCRKKIKIQIITVFHNSPNCYYKSIINQLNIDFSFKGFIKKLFKPLYMFYIEFKYVYKFRKLYFLSSKFVLLSDSFIESFKEMNKIDGKKLIAIENCFLPLDSYRISEVKEKIVLFIGRLDNPQKRVDRLIRIWSKVENDFIDWKLVIVGDGNDRGYLESLAKSLNLTNVYFVGSQKETDFYYKKSSVICLTSDFEGFGMVLVEGMQWGCVPIAFSSYSSIYDIIPNDEIGFVIDAFNEDLYVKKLSLLMAHDDILKRMSLKAIDQSKKFTTDNVIPKWKTLFSELIYNSSVSKY